MLRWLMSSCLLLGSLHMQEQSAAIDTGSICGTVQDERGAPASFTEVVAIDLGPHTGPYTASETNESGQYCVTGLHLGDYAMSAFDEERGYPLMFLAFYAQHLPGKRVTLSPAALQEHVNWRIPFKAGFLRVIVTDARTGQPVEHINTKLSVRSNESFRYSHGTRPGSPILLPPNEDILITVSAPGYESWPGAKGPGRLINIKPGATQTLEVRLKPTAP